MDLPKTKPVVGDKFYDEFEEKYLSTVTPKNKDRVNIIFRSRSSLSDMSKFKNNMYAQVDITKRCIREHNIAIAYLRLHGYPLLQTIKNGINGPYFDTPSTQTQSRSTRVITDRVSCITTDIVEAGSEHFFRLSRRVTIPDFCYDMALFALENNKTYVIRNKTLDGLDLYIAFPNIMKNGIISYTHIISSNVQFKQHFTDTQFDTWKKLCISRKLNLLSGDIELKKIFSSCYCPDNTCDGQYGFECRSHKFNVAACYTCKKKICTKCFKWEHGKFACNATLDEMTAQIIADTTKKCPGCERPTEKNDGCNRMHCKCGTHWCWGCLVKLESHDPYRHNGTVCPNHLPTDMNVWHPDVHLAHIHEEEDVR
jgi:hypothetical protein